MPPPESLPAEIALWLDRLSHDRQHDLGGMLGVVVDGLVRHCQLAVHTEAAAGVWIAVVVRKVRTGDLEPDTMTGLEQVAGRPDRNLIRVDLARLDGLRFLERLAEARAENAVVEQDRLAVRVHISQLGGEVSVFCA